MNESLELKKVKKTIETEVFVPSKEEKITSWRGKESNWIFDFRRVILKAEILNSITEIFWQHFGKNVKFQVGGIEVAAIPLVAGIVMKSSEKNVPTNGFFIRKSRKKDGLMRMVEGEITEELIILVDDILNTGNSFVKQVEVIESLGKKVHTIFVVLRFRDLDYYSYFHQKGINIVSLFSLDDFKDSLNVSNIFSKKESAIPMPFNVSWYFKSENPNYFYVVPKSAPLLDKNHLYFGSDSGNFWCISQSDGSIVWKYKVGMHSRGKNIFSSPSLYEDMVLFGAYDGNFYALDKEIGKVKWIFMEADWIGSSPAVADELGLVFVGLEFGLFNKRGGIACLDANNGNKKWQYHFLGLTHGSPAYFAPKKLVVIGSNDGGVYCFKAKTGELIWKFQTGGEVKASFDFDEKRGYVCFGSHDGKFYTLNIKNGEMVNIYDTEIAIYSSPLIWQEKVYFTSLNKIVYCLNLQTFEMLWKFETNGRIFASPVIVENKVYIGSNDARLYELDPLTGKQTGFFQAVERIVNKIAYNPETKRFFVPTFANEIYCLEKEDIPPQAEKN